jgi:hypothetical protein
VSTTCDAQERRRGKLKSIAQRLGGGDLRSIGDADAVARDLLAHEALVAEAVALMMADDALLRARSADALEKAARQRPAILRPHKRALLRAMETATQQEVRWHIAQMLPLIELSPRERQSAREKLRAYLLDESRIVQVCALQALWDLVTAGKRRGTDLESLAERLAREGAPAVRARARRLLGLTGRRRRR